MAGLLDFLQAASNSAASNVSGPVDGLAWLLRKAGLNVPEDAVGSSAWMEKQGLTRTVKQSGEALLGETAGLLSPMVAAMKAPQIAKGLLQMGENAAAPQTLGKQRGIFMGDLSKTWDKSAADKAMKMEKAGADPRAIWQETGTFKGLDGKWRQEIDDSASMFRGFGAADSKPIGEAIHHPNAMKAYPEMAEMKAQSVPGSGGSFSGEMGYAPSRPTVSLGFDNGPRTNSVALHELQHAVQGRQGFSNGGSPEMESIQSVAKSIYDNAIGQFHGAPEQLMEMARHNAYKRLAGEVEARAVQKRMNLTEAERRALFPLDSYDVPLDKLIIR